VKLYSYWRSSAAYRVRIALNLKGLDYELIPIDLAAGEHLGEEYREVNPQGLVPVLEFSDGIRLSQSQVIVDALETRFPEPSLLPDSSAEVAREIAAVVACEIHPLNNLRVLKSLRERFAADEDQVTAWYHHWLQLGFDTIEARVVDDGEFACGNSPTIADVFIIPQLYNAHRFRFSLENHPKLQRVELACQRLPAFQKAAPEEPQLS